MPFYYSSSNLSTGGGDSNFSSQGLVHNNQGYNPNNAGNTSQAFELNGTGLSLNVRTFNVTTGSGQSTLSAAITEGGTAPTNTGSIFAGGNFFGAKTSNASTAGTTLKSNAQLTSNWGKFTANATNQSYYPLFLSLIHISEPTRQAESRMPSSA